MIGASRRGAEFPICGLTDVRRPWSAAAILGVERVEFLGYGDSGCEELTGRNRNTGIASARGLRSGTLAAIHVDEAAAAVRQILVEEDAVAVTSYDDNGIYGHVDHVRVHEIAARSVDGISCELYESTLDRSAPPPATQGVGRTRPGR